MSQGGVAGYRELTQQMMDAISALLPDAVRNPPRPTPEQLEGIFRAHGQVNVGPPLPPGDDAQGNVQL